MTSVMTPQPNPSPFGLRWKLGEYLNRAMTPKVISSETQSSKAESPSFGNATAVTDKSWGQLPPSLSKPWRRLHRGQYPEGQRQSLKWTEMSLIKTSFPASETFAREGRCDLPGLVWKPRQESNERQLKEGRAAWLVFLITSWSLFCWNIFCSSLVNRAELVRGEWQNHLTGISLSWRSAMCRGKPKNTATCSLHHGAGSVFCTLPKIHWRKNFCKTWMPGVFEQQALVCSTESTVIPKY